MTPRFAALSIKRPACASDDAFTPVWKAFFALRLGISLEQSKQLHIANVLNHFLGRRTERVAGFVLLWVLLTRLSVRVILDLPDKFTNTTVVNLFHNRMWQSTNSEVDVILVYHWLLVILHHELQQTTGFSILSWFVSSSTLKFVRSAQGKLVSRSILILDWVWLAWLWTFGLLNNFSIWFSSNFWTQLFHPIMFQRNLWTVTLCVAEDDCVRSCLIELQSFPLSKLYVTKYTVFWCPFHAFRMYCARRGAFNSIVSRCLCSLSKGSTNRKNTLSVAQHLWSWCQSWTHDEVWIDCFSYMINVLEDTVRYNDIVLWWRINKIASRMTLVSSEVQSWSWRISEVLFTPPPAAKHLSIVSRFPLWTLVHIQVSQYLIIGVWVSVRFDGYLCCFQRQRNPNHTSNILCKKFSDGRNDINTFWYMTSSDSITSTVEMQ